jgi:hypothetical protein
LFSDLTDTSADNLLDDAGVDAVALDDCFLNKTKKICWVHRSKSATAATDWSANCIDNDN